MQTPFKNQFNFTKKEQGGIITLISLIVIISVIPEIYKAIKPAEKITTAERAGIQKLSLSIDQHNKSRYPINGVKGNSGKKVKVFFNFDPNTIDIAGWQNLGVSAKQAQSILNYISRGGKFFKREDLKKMYTISPEVYDQLQPFIRIAPENVVSSKKVFNNEILYKKPTLKIIELNSADSAGLVEIKGIGPAFARRIIVYRDKVGGFYKIEQLMEVYGIDSAKYKDLQAQVKVDPSVIKFINLNTVTFESLKLNPYLRYKQINALISYRKQHGAFKNIGALKEVLALDEETIKKITPYLLF